MVLAKIFAKNLLDRSCNWRIKTKYSCHTRLEHEYIKGRIDGKFYSIEVIYRMFEKPELIIRDFTECKKMIEDLWEQSFEIMKEKFLKFLKENDAYDNFVSNLGNETFDHHYDIVISDDAAEELISSAFSWFDKSIKGDHNYWADLDSDWRSNVL